VGTFAKMIINMNDDEFEGTLVLEKLSEINKLDAFLEAVDSDDFSKARSLMKQAQIDAETIEMVLKKMSAADGNH
jgi:iron uptake system EfeUOB component EfeO/EfeM